MGVIGEWSLPIDEWAKKTEQNVDKARNRLAFYIYSSVVKKTPVDTGRARGNWHISKDAPDPRVIDRTNKEGSITGEETDKLKNINGDETIYIQNNLPYINALENGSSQQAPSGMVRLTMANVEHYLNDAIKDTK